MLEPAHGREEEVEESNGCDHGGGEERRAQPDEVTDDARSERRRWRDREGDEAGRGVHPTE